MTNRTSHRPISTFGCQFLEARNDLNTDISTSFLDTPRRLACRILNAVDNFFVMKLDVPDQHMREQFRAIADLFFVVRDETVLFRQNASVGIGTFENRCADLTSFYRCLFISILHVLGFHFRKFKKYVTTFFSLYDFILFYVYVLCNIRPSPNKANACLYRSGPRKRNQFRFRAS